MEHGRRRKRGGGGGSPKERENERERLQERKKENVIYFLHHTADYGRGKENFLFSFFFSLSLQKNQSRRILRKRKVGNTGGRILPKTK